MVAEMVSSVPPIAVVGMACRVPGAGNVSQFWANISEGVESVRVGSLREHAMAGVPQCELEDPDFVPVTATLPDPEYFDAGMFGMSKAEAELRDPQHRLFLELAHTALEDAGYDPTRYRGDVGVYAGSGEDAYQWRNVRQNSAAMARSGIVGLAVNSHPDYVSTLASYSLGLRGPSMTVHTACSTSLVAVHLACEALRNGECDMALAGAANLELPLHHGYVYLDGGVYSRDGHCRAFDARATGTVWGSGGGVVLLKRLDEAVAGQDSVLGVIIGNAVNNDGSSKVGFTAPSLQGQAAVIAQALSVADVNPRTVGFVEAHGTGTVLGDPIEVAALTSVYQRWSGDCGWCAIGSVKTNIGHLGPAAGVVGLIKAVLAVKHGVIPPSLNYETPNPEIAFEQSPFFVNTAASVWPAGGHHGRRAAVSSFGMGGTNAHVVIEQAPARPAEHGKQGSWQLIQLSAQTRSALATSASALASHLETAVTAAPGDVDDIAYTLRAGRRQLRERLAVPATSAADAASALRDKRRWITGSATPDSRQPVFLFPGQGSQHAGMGRDLYEAETAYRDAVDECADGLEAVGIGLRELLAAHGDDAELRQTRLAQPALFTVGYALAALWRSRGVIPQAMIGHSIGEYVAATCAGVWELQDALRVVARRGELMQAQPEGVMMAVQLDEAELRGNLPEGVSVAAVNGPGACVVSGAAEALGVIAAAWRSAGVSVRALRTSHAFHSPMMDPVLPAFRDFVASVGLNEPRIPFTSGVTGQWITAEEATDPAYWARQVRETVRFGDCVATAAGGDGGLFLECGPGRQLSGLVRMARRGHTCVQCLPGPGEARTGLQSFAEASGQLWAAGVSVDADPAGQPCARVQLPTYPWERQYHWITPDPDATEAAQASPVARPPFAVPVWRQLPPGLDARAATRILLLSGEDSAIADGLSQRGSDVIVVRRGGAFQADGSGGYQVQPACYSDYETLFTELGAHGGIPTHIVHSWTVRDAPVCGAQATWDAQEDGFFSLLSLVQALAVAPRSGDVLLDVVTCAAHEATGGDLLRPEHATLGAAAQVLPLEFPWLTVRHIDTEPQDPHEPPAAPTDLIAEICGASAQAEPSGQQLVALRNGRRWARYFTNIDLPAEASAARADDPQPVAAGFRDRGSYLITGGLGGVGITLAEDLARRFRAKLVLVSRHDLPPRDEWDGSGRAAAVSPRMQRAVAAVRRMEQAGAEVTVIAADVTDPAAVRALRDTVVSRHGDIDGLIHAAGLAGGGMAEIKDRDAAEAVLRPKVTGTLLLHDAFGGHVRDVVVLCSSVEAIAGSFGQIDYSAANAFLDAHASGHHDWGARVISVNWGAWLEVGMAAETAVPAGFRALQQGPSDIPIRHGLLTERHSPADGQPAWCAGPVSPGTHWLLADHRIGGIPVMPGTAYLEAVRCAFEESYPAPGPDHRVEFRDVVLTQPLAVPDGTAAMLRVVLAPGADSTDFEVTSEARGATGPAVVHAHGEVLWAVPVHGPAADLAAIRERCSRGLREGPDLRLSGSGLVTFGPRWGSMVRVHQGDGEDLGQLIARVGPRPDPYPWAIHPALLDEALATGWPDRQERFLPFGYGRVTVLGPMPERAWSHLVYRPTEDTRMVTADLTVYGDGGQEVLRIRDFAMRRADPVVVAQAVAARPAAGSFASAIPPQAGADYFRQVVTSGICPQVAVSARSVDDMIRASRRVDYAAVEHGLGQPEVASAASDSPEGGSAPRTEHERAVARILGDLLGNHELGPDEDFFEAGGNSLVAVQMIAFLRKELGVRISMRRFFADPTIAGVAALIDEMKKPAAGPGGESR